MSRQSIINKAKLKVFIFSGASHGASATAVPYAGVVSIRTASAFESGRNCFNGSFHICNPGRPFFAKTPNFFQYSLSKPTSREGRINRKNRVGVRRLIISAPVITAEADTFSVSQWDRRTLQHESLRIVRFRFCHYQLRSSAAKSADYTCFPAGSRRRTPFFCFPAPHCGVRSVLPVRKITASLSQISYSGRFRAGLRRAQPLKRTDVSGPVFDVSLPKSGGVNPGFF